MSILRTTDMPSGSLTIVGTGIRLDQITTAARSFIENAEKVLYLVVDPVTSSWITDVNPTAESLHTYYHSDKRRLTSYLEMVERILACLRRRLQVCVAFYGHPGIFVYPAHEAIRRARAEGFCARMLPGISAEDCLFADLGIDPARTGCQSFDATDFLIRRRRFDTGSSLILWQIAVTGVLGYRTECDLSGLRVLIDVLKRHYGPRHPAIVYEAAQYSVCEPSIQRLPLQKVPEARITPVSTLYLPPRKTVAADVKMLDLLGIPRSQATRQKGKPARRRLRSRRA